MNRWYVVGTDTGVGKTVVATILATMLGGDYYKPVQTGCEQASDSDWVSSRLPANKHRCHPEAYRLQHPVSPHEAAHREGVQLNAPRLTPPLTDRPLIVELTGGVLCPFDQHSLLVDWFTRLKGNWVIVSHHKLGSINHTLLTVEALRRRSVEPIGIIFNGQAAPYSESFILEQTQCPCLGRLQPEPNLDKPTIRRYSEQWKPTFSQL